MLSLVVRTSAGSTSTRDNMPPAPGIVRLCIGSCALEIIWLSFLSELFIGLGFPPWKVAFAVETSPLLFQCSCPAPWQKNGAQVLLLHILDRSQHVVEILLHHTWELRRDVADNVAHLHESFFGRPLILLQELH